MIPKSDRLLSRCVSQCARDMYLMAYLGCPNTTSPRSRTVHVLGKTRIPVLLVFIGPGHAAMGEAPDPVADWIEATKTGRTNFAVQSNASECGWARAIAEKA